MPTYTVTDPRTKQTKRVTGDSPPTEAELYKIFAVEGGPETSGEGFRQSLADTGLRTVKGIVKTGVSALNPVNLVRGPYELAKDVGFHHGDQTREMVSAVLSGDPDIGGQAIGALAMGGVLGRVLPRVPAMAKTARTAASNISDLGWAGTKGALEHTPLVGPMGKGFIAGVKGRIADTTPIPGARLSTARAPALSESLTQALDEIRSGDTANTPVQMIGNRKPTLNIAQKNRPRIDPQLRGEMVATLPDKWGVTTLLPKERALLKTLAEQPTDAEVLPPVKGKVSLANLSEKELGLELGRLLQKLSTGKGGL